MKLFIVAFFFVVTAFGVNAAPKPFGGISVPVVPVITVPSHTVSEISLLQSVLGTACDQGLTGLVNQVLVALDSILNGLLSSGSCSSETEGLIQTILSLVDQILCSLSENGGLSGTVNTLLDQLSTLLTDLLNSLGGTVTSKISSVCEHVIYRN